MGITLKNLPIGKWRNLTKEEVKSLLSAKKTGPVKTEDENI